MPEEWALAEVPTQGGLRDTLGTPGYEAVTSVKSYHKIFKCFTCDT